MKTHIGDYFCEKRIAKALASGKHPPRHFKSITIEPLKKLVRITVNDGGMELTVVITKEHFNALKGLMK